MALNYAQIIAHVYPTYTLTAIGDGTVYNNIKWSAFNPTGPISQAQLDADIAQHANWYSAPVEMENSHLTELAALGALPESPGLIRKLDHSMYQLDTTNYLSSITSLNVTDALGYTPYNSTNPSNYTTKTYVDSLAASGTVWVDPVLALNFVGDTTSPALLGTIVDGSTIALIGPGGNTGVWSSFSVGDFVGYVNGVWSFRGTSKIGDRVGVNFSRLATLVGVAVGHQDYIGIITGGDAINGWTWTWEAPTAGTAVFNNNPLSVRFGQSFSYVGASSSWVQFGGPSIVESGDALTYVSNVLNVKYGSGITLYNNSLVASMYTGGGIMTTTDGTTTSIATSAQLSLTKTGVTAGQYTLTTVDAHGRITAGTKPTTLSGLGVTYVPDWSTITNIPNTILGYGIIDAQKLDTHLTNISNLNTTGILAITSIAGATSTRTITGTAGNITLSNGDGVAGNPTINLATVGTAGTYQSVTVDAFGRVTAGSTVNTLDNLDDVAITTPTAGQTLSFNGTNWVNIGTTGGATGGGAAKRIWSGNIAASTGTTQIIPGTAAPLSTAGTQLWAATISDPWSVDATYVVTSNIAVAASVNNANLTLALFRTVNGVTTYIGGTLQIVSSGTNSSTLSFSVTDKPNTLLPITYQIRVGTSSATWYVNRRSGEVTFGGLNTGWVMWEY